MAATDFEAMYGFVMPAATASSYDDSASPHSDNEDDNTCSVSEINSSNLEDGSEPKRKSRRPPSTAERRATHNAVERARRESLNGRFMELAAALPSMASVKRPSKSTIVAKSLEYVYTSEDRERALREENASLRREVDVLRGKLGLAPSPPSAVPICSARSPVVQDQTRERVGSFDDSTSSVFSASPSTTGNAFTASPMGNATALEAVSPTFNSVFGRIPEPAAKVDATAASMLATTQPIPVSGMPFHLGMPAAVHQMSPYETNYLMALSMQQQQQVAAQQNALHLAMSGGQAGANWSAFNFGLGGMNHPISSGMHDYPANLVFA